MLRRTFEHTCVTISEFITLVSCAMTWGFATMFGPFRAELSISMVSKK